MLGAIELRRHWGLSMAEPTIAQRSPFRFDVIQGKSYWWCACGRSKNQPFCDGSHKGSEFSPVQYDATETRTVFFCGCKHTGRKPFCDGTHSKLP
jgi:CDGSH-type Zn-finger protein